NGAASPPSPSPGARKAALRCRRRAATASAAASSSRRFRTLASAALSTPLASSARSKRRRPRDAIPELEQAEASGAWPRRRARAGDREGGDWQDRIPLAKRVGAPSRLLEDRGDALAAADAHGFQAVLAVAAVQLAQQVGEDPSAGGADRVPEADARSVDVQAVALVPAPALEHRQHLRRERLVELDEVDVVPRHAGAVEEPLYRRHGPDPHP